MPEISPETGNGLTTFEVNGETFTYPEFVEDLKRLTKGEYLEKYNNDYNLTHSQGMTVFNYGSPYIFKLLAGLDGDKDDKITSFWIGFDPYNTSLDGVSSYTREKLGDIFLVSGGVLQTIPEELRIAHLSIMHLWLEIKKSGNCEKFRCVFDFTKTGVNKSLGN